jgi:hypothetical protein
MYHNIAKKINAVENKLLDHLVEFSSILSEPILQAPCWSTIMVPNFQTGGLTVVITFIVKY